MTKELKIEELEARVAPAGMPMGIGGSNFGTARIPLIGSISVGSAHAPDLPEAALGSSNRFPFEKN